MSARTTETERTSGRDEVVTMAKADDLEDAWRVLDWLRVRINDAYLRRDQVEPCYEMRPALRPLDVYALLPRENCRRCGEATCMAFAFRLLQGRAAVDGCSLLAEERFARHRQALSTMLGGMADRLG